MGCGRSTLGSDSPRRNSKTTDDDVGDTEEREAELHRSPPTPISTHGSPLSTFSSGGQLLAQSKLSDSQLDFFKMLEKKIESGPDYDSEEERTLYQNRLQSGLRQWNEDFQGRSEKNRRQSTDSLALLKIPSEGISPGNSCGKSSKEDSPEEGIDELSEPEIIPRENAKEQYMFMGNVYTLTRLRTDGSHVPHVDVSPAPVPSPVTNASSSGKCKVSGAYTKSSSTPRTRRLQRADTPVVHHSAYRGRVSHARPASLVLHTVFQNQETEATS